MCRSAVVSKTRYRLRTISKPVERVPVAGVEVDADSLSGLCVHVAVGEGAVAVARPSPARRHHETTTSSHRQFLERLAFPEIWACFANS
jgi:hypothetical protein